MGDALSSTGLATERAPPQEIPLHTTPLKFTVKIRRVRFSGAAGRRIVRSIVVDDAVNISGLTVSM